MASESTSNKHRPLVERAGWAVFWNAAFFPLKILIPFIASVIVVRLLRIEGFYLYTVAMSILNQLGIFSDLGIERTLPRFYPEIEMRYGRRGILRMLAWVTVIKGGVLLLLIGGLYFFSAYWIEQFDLGSLGNWLIAFVAILLVLGASSDISIQLLYTHFRQKATNALDLLNAIVYPTLTIIFVLVGMGVLGPLLALLIMTALSVIISLWMVWRLLSSMPEEPQSRSHKVLRPSTRSLRDRFVALSGLNYLVNWTVYLYDLPFLVLTMGLIMPIDDQKKVQIAIISLAYKFTKQFLRGLVVPLTGVQTPLFARLYAEGRIDGLRTAYATITKFLILALLPAAVGIMIGARNVLQIIYGQIGHDAVLNELTLPAVVACTGILAFGLFGESMISVALNVLMVYEDYRAVIVARMVALLSIPLLLLLVPSWGAVGAAIAAAVAGLASRGVALAYAIRKLDLRFPGAFFTRVGAASILMGIALLPILAYLPPNWPSTIFMLAVGAGVFLGAFKWLGGIDYEDKERFRGLHIPFSNAVLRLL